MPSCLVPRVAPDGSLRRAVSSSRRTGYPPLRLCSRSSARCSPILFEFKIQDIVQPSSNSVGDS
uniref:Uncharacterized protein n=1 Tax=Arundo donax TaxID=35708 RepID=A0A0A9A9K1_ARUDO